MATEEELEKAEGTEEGEEPSTDSSADREASSDEASSGSDEGEERDEIESSEEEESTDEERAAKDKAKRSVELTEREGDDNDGGALSPQQLGSQRFVYGAYFGGAIGIAFFASKAVDAAWTRLAMWKPGFGDPHDEYVMPIAAIIGGGAAFYYWKRTRARQLAEEVASELSKVTWPTKQEVTNNTAVVLVTTAFAVVFFALMDRFWGFVTNLVYGS